MGIFSFRAAGEIVFGEGAIGEAGAIIKRHGGKKILLVVDPGFAKGGGLKKSHRSFGKGRVVIRSFRWG